MPSPSSSSETMPEENVGLKQTIGKTLYSASYGQETTTFWGNTSHRCRSRESVARLLTVHVMPGSVSRSRPWLLKQRTAHIRHGAKLEPGSHGLGRCLLAPAVALDGTNGAFWL